jgi:hypothetical protein
MQWPTSYSIHLSVRLLQDANYIVGNNFVDRNIGGAPFGRSDDQAVKPQDGGRHDSAEADEDRGTRRILLEEK